MNMRKKSRLTKVIVHNWLPRWPVVKPIVSASSCPQKLDGIAESVAALHGSLKVVEKLPEIIGNVVKELTCKKD